MSSVSPNPLEARAILKRFGIRPDKKLGQHFVVSELALRHILDAADVRAHETVLEVGAGLGALTSRLAEVAERVVAVELDRRLLAPLEQMLRGRVGIQIVPGDIMELNWSALGLQAPYCVVANIPYGITSGLIRRLLEAPDAPERLVLTVQREVAERVNATPGAMSLLALSVQLYGKPAISARIPPAAFYPQPGVVSAVLRIVTHPHPEVPEAQIGQVFKLARAGFSQRRKQLKNSISAGLGTTADAAATWLREAGIDPTARAQELGVHDWQRLAEVVPAQ